MNPVNDPNLTNERETKPSNMLESRTVIGDHLTSLATLFVCSPEYYILSSSISICCIHQTSLNFSLFRNVLKYFVLFSFVVMGLFLLGNFIYNLSGINFKRDRSKCLVYSLIWNWEKISVFSLCEPYPTLRIAQWLYFIPMPLKCWLSSSL